MATDPKFFKTEITVTVLSEQPIPEELELAEIMREATHSSYVAGPEERA